MRVVAEFHDTEVISLLEAPLEALLGAALHACFQSCPDGMYALAQGCRLQPLKHTEEQQSNQTRATSTGMWCTLRIGSLESQGEQHIC